jgi:hypothetical protein
VPEALVSDELSAWLAERRPPPPPALARALERAVAVPPGEAAITAEAQLAAAAGAALRLTLALGAARPAAYQLLAADALLTYAIELAAEQGVDALMALLDELTPAALAELAGEQP